MSHPSSLDLEAFAVSEPLLPQHADHVQRCADCARFVADLRALVAAGPSHAEAELAVARAASRAESPAPGSRVVRAAARECENRTLTKKDPKRTLWLIATSVVTPLAAAAILLLLLRSQPLEPQAQAPQPSSTGPSETNGSRVARIEMAPLEPSVTSLVGAAEPDTQFKGGPQVAIVRERDGEQARFSRAVRVRPGDRIRVEVALDREQAILGAVLGEDGTYLELMPDAVRGPGTHFSEKSAKFDSTEMRGTILVGTAVAVARARATKSFEGVTAVRVEWESL
jgi:hypothetical protein